MEFLAIIAIVAAIGGALGYFAAKKHQAAKNRRIEAVLLCAALGLAVYAAFTVSKVYFACVVLLTGELIRIAVPQKKE